MKIFYPLFGRKFLIVSIIVMLVFKNTNAQQTIVYADPALGSVDLTNIAGVSVDANQLNLNSSYFVKVGVLNLDQASAIPPNTAYVDIAVGSKMVFDPSFNLSTAPLNNYFSYSYITGANPKIRCQIINALPPDFSGVFQFRVIAGPQSVFSSTITGNFFVANNSTTFLLSDVRQNNSADLQYIVGPAAGLLPVTITNFTARNKECNIDINWTASQEINLARYEVEVSKDGTRFATITTVDATNKANYNATIELTEQLKAPVLYIRVKSIDVDGTFKYSSIVSVKGNCQITSKQVISCYPNPVTSESSITIAAKGETFKGDYFISMLDAVGKTYLARKITLLDEANFKLNLKKGLAAGKYFIKLQKQGDANISTLQFIKE